MERSVNLSHGPKRSCALTAPLLSRLRIEVADEFSRRAGRGESIGRRVALSRGKGSHVQDLAIDKAADRHCYLPGRRCCLREHFEVARLIQFEKIARFIEQREFRTPRIYQAMLQNRFPDTRRIERLVSVSGRSVRATRRDLTSGVSINYLCRLEAVGIYDNALVGVRLKLTQTSSGTPVEFRLQICKSASSRVSVQSDGHGE